MGAERERARRRILARIQCQEIRPLTKYFVKVLGDSDSEEEYSSYNNDVRSSGESESAAASSAAVKVSAPADFSFLQLFIPPLGDNR